MHPERPRSARASDALPPFLWGQGVLRPGPGSLRVLQPSPGVSPRAACVSLQATVEIGLDVSRSLAPQGPAYGVRRPSGVSGLGAGTEALWGQELRRVLRRPQASPEMLSAGRAGTVGWRSAACSSGQSRLIAIVATQSISPLRAVLGQSEAWQTLLQALRTRIFPSLEPPRPGAPAASAPVRPPLVEPVEGRMKRALRHVEDLSRDRPDAGNGKEKRDLLAT